jgi:hypothetical protein
MQSHSPDAARITPCGIQIRFSKWASAKALTSDAAAALLAFQPWSSSSPAARLSS